MSCVLADQSDEVYYDRDREACGYPRPVWDRIVRDVMVTRFRKQLDEATVQSIADYSESIYIEVFIDTGEEDVEEHDGESLYTESDLDFSTSAPDPDKMDLDDQLVVEEDECSDDECDEIKGSNIPDQYYSRMLAEGKDPITVYYAKDDFPRGQRQSFYHLLTGVDYYVFCTSYNSRIRHRLKKYSDVFVYNRGTKSVWSEDNKYLRCRFEQVLTKDESEMAKLRSFGNAIGYQFQHAFVARGGLRHSFEEIMKIVLHFDFCANLCKRSCYCVHRVTYAGIKMAILKFDTESG